MSSVCVSFVLFSVHVPNVAGEKSPPLTHQQNTEPMECDNQKRKMTCAAQKIVHWGMGNISIERENYKIYSALLLPS